MSNPNLARNLFIASGAVIACLGLTACGGEATAESTPPVTTLPSPETRTDDTRQTSITQTYMPNGTRYTFFSDKYGNSDFRSVLAYCDGDSMIEITSAGSYGGGALNVFIRVTTEDLTLKTLCENRNAC